MAPRQTARRLLVAAPALAIAALAVTACSPPNEQPADPDAPYTLPTYSEESTPTESETTTEAPEGEDSETTTEEQDPAGTAGGPEAPPAAETPLDPANPVDPANPAAPENQPAP